MLSLNQNTSYLENLQNSWEAIDPFMIGHPSKSTHQQCTWVILIMHNWFAFQILQYERRTLSILWQWTYFSDDGGHRLLPSPVIDARTELMFKLMKMAGIPYCVHSPNYLGMISMALWQTSHTCKSWTMQSGVPEGVLISSNAMVSLSLLWHTTTLV